MITKALIDDFMSQKTLAIAGISNQGTKFGNTIYKEMKSKGYKLFPIHPHIKEYDGETCYSDLSSLPEQVQGMIICIKPGKAEQLVRDVEKAGIKRIWLQQGAESDFAIKFCNDNGINVIYKHCILMFLEPVKFPHSFHRWFLKLFGKYPK